MAMFFFCHERLFAVSAPTTHADVLKALGETELGHASVGRRGLSLAASDPEMSLLHHFDDRDGTFTVDMTYPVSLFRTQAFLRKCVGRE